MADIDTQLKQPYVGAVVHLIHISLFNIGSPNEFFLTPSSHTSIAFNGDTYTPFPIEITGLERSANAAPNRVRMSVSNINQMLMAAVINYGDMVGGKVRYIRTFENFLDGQPDGGTQQSFPELRYVILQKNSMSQAGIEFTLGTELDRPTLMIPRRQCLKSDVGKGALYVPGMSRSR